jgi:hypothetical protein
MNNEAIEKFENNGYAEASLGLLRYIRQNNILIRIFNCAKNKGTNRIYGARILFGGYRKYYYNIEYKDKFVDFIVKKFYQNNPDPGPGIRTAFTRTLHQNGLHWEGCKCLNKNQK